ncbi:MAG: rRNA maturation RNase YbeY [Bacteroidia bacterium]
MAITFNSQTSGFSPKGKPAIRNWVKIIAKKEKRDCGNINYIFCTDEELLRMNIQYLNHKTLTDIITFDYSEGVKIAGDIFVSVERIEENAKKYKVEFENELHRVMIHGVLHLCGYKDKTPKDKKQMRKKEDEALALFAK